MKNEKMKNDVKHDDTEPARVPSSHVDGSPRDDAMRALARLAPRVGVGVGVDARETTRCRRRRRLDRVDSTAGRADATRAEDAREAISRGETGEETFVRSLAPRIERARGVGEESAATAMTSMTSAERADATDGDAVVTTSTRARRRRRETDGVEARTTDGGVSRREEDGRGRREARARERWADARARAASTSASANVKLDADEERVLGESIQRLLRIEREMEAREDAETAENLEAAETLGAVEAIARRERRKKESKRRTKDSLAIELGYENASRLCAAMREGKMARKKLVTANISLAAKLAKKMYARVPPQERASMTLQDMVHEGVLGLVRASEKYDPSKGYRFTTYAYRWIVKWITIGVHANGRTIRLPQHAHEWRRTALSRREDVEAELGREATLKEVAEASPEFSVEKLRLLRDVSLDPLSLDGKDDVFASPSDDADEVSREMENEIFRDALSRVFARDNFPKVEAYVLAHRFGLVGEPMTRGDIARRIGKSAEGVRYLEHKGLNRLKDLDLEQHLDTSNDVVRAIESPKEETEKPKHRRRKKSSAAAKRKPAKDATPSAIDLVRSSGLL